MAVPDTYHHGDLRAAMLDKTAQEIARTGVNAVSFRAIAAAIGVSHTAPRHHFGSREGLFTALATQGYELLAESLTTTRHENPGNFLAIGLAYVQFCTDHPGHLPVMFDHDLVIVDDAALSDARKRAFDQIGAGLEEFNDLEAKRDMAAATVAGWSLMHGLVALHTSGALGHSEVLDVLGTPPLLELAERAGRMLYGSPPSPQPDSNDVESGQEPINPN